MLGLFCGVASQGVHILGRRLHVDALTWHRLPGRDSGWWDPVIAGSLLVRWWGLPREPVAGEKQCANVCSA